MYDLRDAIRSLRSTPVVTAAAVLSLALGIGANTAIFSILNSLLLRTLPVRDANGLAAIGSSDAPGEDADLMHPAWIALRDRGLLDGAFAWAKDVLSDVQAGETRPVNAIWASDRFFDTLGVMPAIGRTPGVQESAAVISAGFWKRRFGGDADIVGRTIVLDRVPFTIVGVAPPSFFGLEVGTSFDVVLPLESEPLLQRVPSRLKQWPWLHVVGRIPSDRTFASVANELHQVEPAIRAETNPYSSPEEHDAYLKENWTLRSAATGTSRLRGRYGSALTTLMGIAALVLLIGCANIANLQLARADARRFERSVRTALGASRWRLMRPLLLESALVAFAGTLIGIAMAGRAAALLVAQLATWVSVPVLDLSPDARVLAVSTGLMLATLLMFGVAPSVAAGRAAPIDALRRAPSRARGLRARAGEILIGLQIAVCMLLLVGAALFIRSFMTLVSRDLGFDRRPVLVATVNAKRSSVPPSRRLTMYERLRESAAALPGVESAAISMATPIGNAGVRFMPRVSLTAADVQSSAAPRVLTNVISPGWFRAYGTRLVAGRDFSDREGTGTTAVAIVNEAFAQRYFAGRSALGRAFFTTTPGLSSAGPAAPEIVGIVQDAAFTNVRNPVEPTIYRPIAQTVGEDLLKAVPDICISIRAAAGVSPETLRKSVARALAAVDTNAAVSTVTVSTQLDANYVRERLLGLLAGSFALLGQLLAAIGLYGVTAHSVNGRRRELAVRMALGADRRRISGLVFRRLAIVAACGIASGIVASAIAGRFIESLLYSITVRDPLAFAAGAVALIGTSFAAGWLPARRAARTEPMIVLREP